MDVAIPSGMLQAGARLAAWVCDQRSIDPNANGVYVDDAGRSINIENITGHRLIASPDFPTSCPGDIGVTQLPDLRQRITQLIASSPTSTPTPTPTNTPTRTPTSTATATGTPPTATPSSTATATTEPSSTPTSTNTPTPTQSATPTSTTTATTGPTATTRTPRTIRIVGSGRSSNSSSSTAIYDGDVATYWATNVAASVRFANVYVDLGVVNAIQQIRWVFAVTGWAPEYKVQVSSDKRSWSTVYTGGNSSVGYWRRLDVSVQARYVRWYFRNVDNSPNLGGLAEVQILG